MTELGAWHKLETVGNGWTFFFFLYPSGSFREGVFVYVAETLAGGQYTLVNYCVCVCVCVCVRVCCACCVVCVCVTVPWVALSGALLFFYLFIQYFFFVSVCVCVCVCVTCVCVCVCVCHVCVCVLLRARLFVVCLPHWFPFSSHIYDVCVEVKFMDQKPLFLNPIQKTLSCIWKWDWFDLFENAIV